MMKRKRIVISIIYMLMIMIVVSCSSEEIINESGRIKKKEQAIEEKEIGRDIELTSYAKEIGLLLRTPSYDEFDTHSVVDIEGDIEQFENLHSDHLWIVITKGMKLKKSMYKTLITIFQ